MTGQRKRRGSENRLRKHQVAVRLSPAEMSLLAVVAKRTGMTPASVLRAAFIACPSEWIRAAPGKGAQGDAFAVAAGEITGTSWADALARMSLGAASAKFSEDSAGPSS